MRSHNDPHISYSRTAAPALWWSASGETSTTPTRQMAPGGRFGRRSTLVATQNEASIGSTSTTSPTMGATSSGQASLLTRNVRGPTIGLGLEKLNRANGKLRINVDEEKGRPVQRTQSSKLASEIGIISRQFVQPPTKWRKLDPSSFDAMYDRLEERFDVDLNQPHVRKSCEAQLKNRLNSRRCKLHKVFLSFNSETEARENPPDDVGVQEWGDLIDMWTTEAWKAKSEKNKVNRSKVKAPHRMGSKSYEVAREELRNKESGEEKDPIQFYHDANYSEAEGWRSEKAEASYNAMIELQSRPNEEGSIPLTSSEIVKMVLGKRAGYAMSLGRERIASNSIYERYNTALENELKECKQQLAQMSEHVQLLLAHQKKYEELLTRRD